MKLFIYPKCSTCHKALKYLHDKHLSVQPVDISITPPNKTELKTMLQIYEGNLRKLFNTSGKQYRELKLKDKLAEMSQEDALTLLSKNGMLVKRPFLLTKDGGAVGFKPAEWDELL
jgi:arsenate reductase